MKQPDRILIVKLSSLGDLFHAMPIAHLLQKHTGASIDWVTQPEYVKLVGCHGDISRVIAYPLRGGLLAWKQFVGELRRDHYDWVIDLQGLWKSGVVCGLAHADRKIGVSFPREGASLFWHETPNPRSSEDRHALLALQDTLAHLNLPLEPLEYPLNFPPFPLSSSPRKRVALAAKSRWPAKDWPVASFTELASRLLASGHDIVLTGGPQDAEACDEISLARGGHGEVLNLCGACSLLQLGDLLRQVDVLVCNDTGPMHFAAAVGTPVVALFGPTDPVRTGPFGPQHIVLRPPEPEEGYPPHRSFKKASPDFIAQITVEHVVDAVHTQLERAH